MSTPMTKQGFENLQRDVDELQKKRPEIQKAISEAREKGDLKENAEYHAARESLAMLEAQIAEKESTLASATIISEANRDTSVIQFGASVKVLDVEYDEEEDYKLVGPGENDPRNNKILTSSPMGQAMLNKKVGDTVLVDAPAGKIEYKVLEISYED